METERDAVKGSGTLLTRVMSMMNKVMGRSMASLLLFFGARSTCHDSGHISVYHEFYESAALGGALHLREFLCALIKVL